MDQMRKGKTYFITGGASGLGLATAELLHSQGANISIADRNVEAGESVCKRLGESRCLFVEVDVTDEKSVARAVDETVKKFGSLHGCINSAGVGSATLTVNRKLKPEQQYLGLCYEN